MFLNFILIVTDKVFCTGDKKFDFMPNIVPFIGNSIVKLNFADRFTDDTLGLKILFQESICLALFVVLEKVENFIGFSCGQL